MKTFFKILKTFLIITIPVFFVNFLVFTLALTSPNSSAALENYVEFFKSTPYDQVKEGALGIGGVFQTFMLQLDPDGSEMPDCDASTRGIIWYEEGEEDKVFYCSKSYDKLMFCHKNNGDRYSWETVSYSDPCGGISTLVDTRDSNSYNIVEIGDQCWMSENLSYLPSVVDPSTGGPNSPYYYVYEYEETDVSAAKSSSNYKDYGVLYNWHAAMFGDVKEGVRGICPDGWRLPTDYDWHLLESYLSKGDCDVTRSGFDCDPAGKLMKAKEWGGVEESLFQALPGGFRNPEGKFSNLDSHGYFWSSSSSDDVVWGRYLEEDSSMIARFSDNKEQGLSVRCIKD